MKSIFLKKRKKKYKFTIIEDKDFQTALVILDSVYGIEVHDIKENVMENAEDEESHLQLNDSDWRLLLCGNNFLLTYHLNQPIIVQGSDIDKLYVISRGSALAKIHMEDQEYTLGIMEQGEMIGDLSFLMGKKASCTVIANEDDVQIFIVDRIYLRYLFESYPELASKFLRHICLTIGKRIYLRETEGNTFTLSEDNVIPRILRKFDSGRSKKFKKNK